MQNKNLGSEKLSELEKVRRVISIKQKSLNSLMIEICQLRELEKSLMPLTQELERLEKGTGKDELEPVEPLFAVSRTYQPG